MKSWMNHAPSEVRTHDLEIMRLARCLLRYRGHHRSQISWSQLYSEVTIEVKFYGHSYIASLLADELRIS